MANRPKIDSMGDNLKPELGDRIQSFGIGLVLIMMGVWMLSRATMTVDYILGFTALVLGGYPFQKTLLGMKKVSEKHTNDSHINADVSELVKDCNLFACDLFSLLSENQDGNLFFSPSSISSALAMTFAGAKGETAREMKDTLRFSLPPHRLHQAFQQLKEETRTGGIEFRVANRLWGQKGYQFLDDFLKLTDQHYSAMLESLDFSTDAEHARHTINKWVEDQTVQKIKELIGSGMLSEETRLVLTNAIYFLGCWENEFDVDSTVDAPFYVDSEKTVTVPMMNQTDYFGYAESEDFQVLQLPYRSMQVDMNTVLDEDNIEDFKVAEVPDSGSDFSMYILLPRKTDGLKKLEDNFTADRLLQALTLQHCEVSVSIPKFRIQSSFELSDTLQSLGMQQAFSPENANFSGMSHDPEGLFIGAAIHKAFVDVNERGTEAAAATAAFLCGLALNPPAPPKTFLANHPFLFVIRDNKTQLIHFIGRMMSPKESI